MKSKSVFSSILFILLFTGSLFSQKVDSLKTLTVAQIMQNPSWIGNLPSNVFWADNSKTVYFKWNPENTDSDSLYAVNIEDTIPYKVPAKLRKSMPSQYGSYNKAHTEKVYTKDGDIFLLNIKTGKVLQLTKTIAYEYNPVFLLDGNSVCYTLNNNIFKFNLKSGTTVQLTNFVKGKAKQKQEPTPQQKFLQSEQQNLFKYISEKKDKENEYKNEKEKRLSKLPLKIYSGNYTFRNIKVSPKGDFITFLLVNYPKNAKKTTIPKYVTESGYTKTGKAYPLVGSPQSKYKFGVLNLKRNSVKYVSSKNIPGIKKYPKYIFEYKNFANVIDTSKNREVIINGPVWNNTGNRAVVVVRSIDNKDRWIMQLNPETGGLTNLDWQHDEAWIGGPGISSWNGSTGLLGWLNDNKTIYYQSERTGYSHLYTLDVTTREKHQITKGKFEIYNVKLSKNEKHWYFVSNATHPGDRQFYKMNLDGSQLERITNLAGNNRVSISPNEKELAILYSYTNKPWELYLMENKPDGKMIQVTKSLSKTFKTYPWRDPKIITFKAKDGAKVYARIYKPKANVKNNAAVIFVHGAGYLQNAHKWWSDYFREYMFNNLLADKGYTVLDIDYRGSAGYGKNWRTAIYRNMGGKDLSDQVDGAKLLVPKYGIDSTRIGIYGGSYGGFITLFAMFKEANVFKSGAALRSVTDWAHYHHGYTANILNTPQTDSLAFVHSSPIYFAEGLKGNLLMCHGMVDDNVHFQDIVRLTQRLIELGKVNWELAVYPVERHGFKRPSSWTDEYRRILKLFETTIGK